MYRIEYDSTIKGECADDINIKSIIKDNEEEFLNWAKILEDTITHLIQSINYYNDICSFCFMNSEIFKEFNTVFVNLIANLITVITIDFGKLYLYNDKFNLHRFNEFCRDNQELFKKYDDGIYVSCRNIISKQVKIFYQKMAKVRNKKIAHNDRWAFDIKMVNNYMKLVSIKEIEDLANQAKVVMTKIWYAYNQHQMCFTFKNNNDYKKILEILKKAVEN